MASEAGQIAVANASKSIPVLKSLANDPTAAWRSVTNSAGVAVNVNNMITYTERDVTASWFGDLPASAREGFKNLYANFLSAVVYNGTAFEVAYNTFVKDIEDAMKG